MRPRNKPVGIDGKWLALILSLAAGLRLTSLVFARNLPFFEHHRLDALLYHQAGQAYMRGGAWADGVFHMSPLYQLFVGCSYRLFGDGPWGLRLVQLVLGLLTVGGLFFAAQWLWGRGAGRIAGIIAACYGPFIFYEEQIMLACLATCLMTAFLALTIWRLQKPQAPLAGWVGVGLLLGLLILARPNSLLLVPVVLLFGWERSSPKRSVLAGSITVACAALLVAPVSIQNYKNSGELILVTDSGGLNFYLGNGPGAHGSFRIPEQIPEARNADSQFTAFKLKAEELAGHSLSSRAVDRFWYEQSFSHIAEHKAGWGKLLLRKLWLFWSARELPNTMDYSFYRLLHPLLGLPLVQVFALLPLALLGAGLLAFKGTAAERFVVCTLVTQMAGLVLFFVLAHYRVPAVPCLILCATRAVLWIAWAIKSQHWSRLLAASPVLVIGSALAAAPQLPKPFDDEYFKLGYAYQVRHQFEEAESAYIKAIKINESNISAHKNLGVLYESLYRRKGAESEFLTVLRLARETSNYEYEQFALEKLHQLGDRSPPEGRDANP